MGELDALMSLALAAEQASAWGPVCRPVILSRMPGDRQVMVAAYISAISYPNSFLSDDPLSLLPVLLCDKYSQS